MGSNFYKRLSELAGWLSAILFILGSIGKLTGQDILFTGNDHWQAAMFLIFFAIFSKLMTRE